MKFGKPLSLRSRFLIAPFIAVLLTLILYSFSNNIIQSNSQLFHEVTDKHIPHISKVSHLTVELNDNHNQLSQFLVSEDYFSEEQVYEKGREFLNSVHRIENDLLVGIQGSIDINEQEKEHTLRIKKSLLYYREVSIAIIELYSLGEISAAKEQLKVADDEIHKLNGQFLTLSDFQLKNLSKESRSIKESLYDHNSLAFVASTLLFIMIASALFFSRKLSFDIDRVNRALIDLSQGDKDVDLSVHKKSYLSDIQKALNVFKNSLEENEKNNENLSAVITELKESNDRYFGLLDLTPAGIVAIDDSQKIVLFNKAAEKIFGYKKSELIGQPVTLLMPESFRGAHDANVNSFENSGDGYKLSMNRLSVPGLTKQGTKIHVEISISQMKLVGEPIKTAAINDVTERNRMQRALLESETRWRSLADNSPNHIMLIDEEFNIQYINYTVDDLSPEQVVGKVYLDFVPEAEHQVAVECFERVKKTGKQDRYETAYLTQDGEMRYFDVRVSLLDDNTGQSIHYISSSSDITDIKVARSELVESESRFRILMEKAPEAIILFDGESQKVIEVNENALFLFGLSKEELFNYGPLDLTPAFQLDGTSTVDALNNQIEKAMAGESQVFEWIHINQKTQKEFPCEVRIVPIPLLGRIVMRVSLIDISLRKQTEAELELHRENLEILVEERTQELNQSLHELELAQKEMVVAQEKSHTASQAKSDFLAHMSHEIRTPMNGILAMADLLLEQKLEQQQQEYVRVIKQSGSALLAILNDILDISKIEAGKVELHFHQFNLSQLLNEVVSVFSEELRKKSIAFDLKLNSLIPLSILTDSVRLRQILLNVLGNAIKFSSQEGSITLAVNLSRPANSAVEEMRLTFSVKDTGVGIPLAQQSKIFDAFTQADSSVTRHYGGTGLGLQICKQLCGLLGGEIGLQSKPDEGTTVSFSIPVQCSEIKPVEILSERSNSLKSANEVTVLVVEDNPTNQQVATAVLQRLGYQVDVIDNGHDAISSLENKAYDLILMDCQMPIMDGYQATEIIRKKRRFKKLPIIAMTASATLDEQKRCKDVGMNDFISKPIDLRLVQRVLEKWH